MLHLLACLLLSFQSLGTDRTKALIVIAKKDTGVLFAYVLLGSTWTLFMPKQWHRYSLSTALCSFSTEFLGNFRARLVFPLQRPSICQFPGSHVEIVFGLFSLKRMRTKWNGKNTHKNPNISKKVTLKKESIRLSACECKQVWVNHSYC